MSTPIDRFQEICDEQLGAEAGQEHLDVDAKPFMYRYDYCVYDTPCSIAILYTNYMLVGCMQHNGYTFSCKSRYVTLESVEQMAAQIRTIRLAVVENLVESEDEYLGVSMNYDVVGTWDVRKGGLQIDDYLRVNSYGGVVGGPGYARMPLEQMASVGDVVKPDVVNAPKHYAWLGNALAEQVENVGDVEVFHVLMAAFDKEPLLWQVGKYLLRAGRKDDRKQDLEKARWYLDKAIED
jgi:hypothetical protein|nr:MAG TPA: nucelotide kinase [Caudoviricetes sp.]